MRGAMRAAARSGAPGSGGGWYSGGRGRAPRCVHWTGQVVGNPVNLAFSVDSLLTVTRGASDTLAFGTGTGIPSFVMFSRSSRN